jgi:Domain of unknown function (DUF4384)
MFTHPHLPALATRGLSLCLCLSLSATLMGCASPPSARAVAQARADNNPPDRTQRSITNFTPALRCMDEMMFRNGTRDVTLMMEELRDATQKVHVSARDMMTSAISDMTRRSRAVRLSVFGNDQQNLQQLLQLAQKNSPFAVLPEYNLRGTISQLDEEVRRDSTSFGVQIAQAFGLRVAQDVKFSVLGFDSALVRTETMTLVPGVSSKNTTVIARRDSSAGDAQGQGQSQGRLLSAVSVFSFASARSEGTAQAARNMVELAAIELVGKLIRAPYWQCVGIEDDAAEVQREMEDWFLAMDEEEQLIFFKERLRERRYFDGALDGTRHEGFDTALALYRRALGLPEFGALDLSFFRRFITRTVPLGPLAPLPRKAPAATPPALAAASVAAAVPTTSTTAAAAPATAPATASATAPTTAPTTAPPPPFGLLTRIDGDANALQLRITADVAGYVYCYAQDPQTQAIRRIFPNRFAHDPRVEAGRAVALPSGGKFKLPRTHRYACLHAPREIYNDLPPPLRWGDFDDIRLTSFEAIRQQFAAASGLPISLVSLLGHE